ncbi:MAG: CvpA family protein [Peptococcaceae bacterium]|jgi:uncharacterized membrane protein required for colicin V production|nr:CvpA family protein [Peptococcaceae bacterium]
MNITDVLIIGMISLGALLGYKRGLIGGLVNLVGSIAAFLIAAYEYAKIVAWIEAKFQVKEWLEPIVFNLIKPVLETQIQANSGKMIDSVMQLVPPEMWSILGEEAGSAGLNSITQNALQQVGHTLAGALTGQILNLFVFALTFFLVLFLIKLAGMLVLKPFGLLGGAVNRAGGFIFGAISVALVLAVLAGIISPFITLEIAGTTGTMIQQSVLYPYLLQLFQLVDAALKTQLAPQLWQKLSLLNK